MGKTILGSSRHGNLFFTAVASLVFAVLTANISASEPSLDKATPSFPLFKESVTGRGNDRGDSATRVKVQENYGKLPLYFIENQGQINEMVKFYEQGNGHTTFFTKRGIYLSLAGATPRVYPDKSDTRLSCPQAFLEEKEIKDRVGGVSEGNIPTSSTKLATIRFVPLGANSNPEITAEELQECKVNYIMGNDPEKWKTNIPTYKSVVYKGIYKNIDMRFYGNNRQLEYDIIVNPGASPSRIQLLYDGVEDLRVNGEGDLEISLKEGNLTQKKPYVYQEIDGKRKEIEGRFIISNHRASSVEVSKEHGHGQRFIYGFQVASYDKEKPLIIDPVLAYSTYLGGNSIDAGYGIAVDTSGNAYVTGSTYSTNFPTQSPIQGSNGGSSDAFVTKINSSGTALVYSTYLGGSSYEWGYGIAVDTSGNAYVTGITASTNFPTQNPIQGSNAGGWDVFVAKIIPTGTALAYSTYLGGSSQDWGIRIAVDTSGNAYVTGRTDSTNFPTQGPIQGSNAGKMDVYLTKINPSGTALTYSTYLGGSSTDEGYDIAVDTSGNAYVTGWTESINFPTQSPIQGAKGKYYDAFVTKINSSGSALVYSTYLGGKGYDWGYGIAVDTSGNVYVSGETGSTDFPTQDAYDTTCGTDGNCNFDGKHYYADAFVTKINSSGSALVYSTYLGGSHADGGNGGIAIDTSGNAYVTGNTMSTDFPTQIPIQGSFGGVLDAFVTKINSSGSSLAYSTYLGGSNPEECLGIAVDTSGNAYVTGSTGSTDFPTTPGAFDTSFNGGWYDAFVTKIASSPCVGDGKVKTVETDTGDFELLKLASKVVTVTVTDGGGCPVADVRVSAKVNSAGKKRIGISPSSKTTDGNGKAAFTITAKEKTGKAKVTFKAGGVKKQITVTVK